MAPLPVIGAGLKSEVGRPSLALMTACQAIHRALHARVWAQLRHLLTTTFGAGTREAPEVANWRNHPPLRQPLHRPSLHVTLAFAADAKAAIQGVEV